MGILEYLEKKSAKTGEKQARKLAIDTAKVMLNITLNASRMFGPLHPHEIARTCINGRPRWSQGENFTLLFDGISTNIAFTEGIDVADIIEYVVSTELAANPLLKNIPNGERLIPFAGQIAKEYVLNNCGQSLLRNR